MIHYHLAKTQKVFSLMIIAGIFIAKGLFAADGSAYLDSIQKPVDQGLSEDKKWRKPSNEKFLPELPPNVEPPSQPVLLIKPPTSIKVAPKAKTKKAKSKPAKKYSLTDLQVDSDTVKSASGTANTVNPAGFIGKEKLWPVNTCLRGFDPNGKQIDVKGEPHGVIMLNGQVMLELFDKATGSLCYLNPIALQTEPRNEHPADRSLRFAREEKLSLDPRFAARLQDLKERDQFFTNIVFEYTPGKYVSGIIVGMNADSSYNVLVKDVPQEWQGTREIADPNYFVVYPEHIQTEFDPAALGYKLVPQQFGATLHDQVKTIFKLSQPGVHSSRWAGDMLRLIGVKLDPWEKELLAFNSAGGEEYFSTVQENGGPGPWRIRKIRTDGKLETVYDTPGRITGFIVNPLDHNKLLISAEGYNTDDPRSKSLFEYDQITKKEVIVRFPSTAKHSSDQLFVNSVFYGKDGLIYISRCGFAKEGGGIWALDPLQVNYGITENSTALINVDHILAMKCLDDFLTRETSELLQRTDKGMAPRCQIVYTVKQVSKKKDPTMKTKAFSAILSGGIGIEPEISGSREIAKLQGREPFIAGFSADTITNYLVIYFQTPEDPESDQGSYAMAVYKVCIPLP